MSVSDRTVVAVLDLPRELELGWKMRKVERACVFYDIVELFNELTCSCPNSGLRCIAFMSETI